MYYFYFIACNLMYVYLEVSFISTIYDSWVDAHPVKYSKQAKFPSLAGHDLVVLCCFLSSVCSFSSKLKAEQPGADIHWKYHSFSPKPADDANTKCHQYEHSAASFDTFFFPDCICSLHHLCKSNFWSWAFNSFMSGYITFFQNADSVIEKPSNDFNLMK